MATAAEVQALLRFLSQDAKVPLSVCLPKVSDLRKAQLGSSEDLSKSDLKTITTIISDEKLAKQILNAAKRVTNSKKRAATESVPSTASKLIKGIDGSAQPSESALELPCSDLKKEELAKISLQTNRAPLVLAFAVSLLRYTMPGQPTSSRLSLAQAVVSANSQTKAKSIGLITENTAEEDGWGKGQPKIKVMGREVAVMRRVSTQEDVAKDSTQTTVKAEDREIYWGMDLDALKKSNGPLIAGKNSGSATGLPIYTPVSARNYLLRSMTIADDEVVRGANTESSIKAEEGLEVKPSTNAKIDKESSPKPLSAKKKPSAKELIAKKEHAAAVLLQTLNLLFSSWAHLSHDELDRRAWSWYLHVRPDIAQGQAGWGQKGLVKLADILKLCKQAGS